MPDICHCQIVLLLTPHPTLPLQVYELRDASWFDRGTGQCKGVYDDTQDLALLIVEAEDSPEAAKNGEEGPGGFLKEELLLSARVDREDIYSRQQGGPLRFAESSASADQGQKLSSCGQNRRPS